MDPHSRRVLEYDRVLALVARNAHWVPGREAVLSLGPAESVEELAGRQAEVREAGWLFDRAAGIGAGGLEDVRDPIQAASRGRMLQPQDLLAVVALARASRKTGRYLRDHEGDVPLLAGRAFRLPALPHLEQEVEKALGVDGRVLDSASPKLRHLRNELAALQGRIHDQMNRILRNAAYSRMLQEGLVTLRDGRQVVPVRAEYRSQFPGLVIDQSASGATLFMEPWSVVELGNRVRAAALAEQKEVEAVLARLSGLAGHNGEELEAACEELGHLDMLLALAILERDLGGVLPTVTSGGAFRLVDARHPLLAMAAGREVVPISLEVGEDIRTVVVTGPNTGGKTVALKTTGLMAMMALAGMPIPARSGSTLPFFRAVWADIGDEQSIAQNLSTFSGHLTQILRILPGAGPETLVLLDELGAGTDPSEGSALGMALLGYFHARGCRTVVTTHLSELKVFASQTPGVTNAAVEFDPETLEPTFRVIMGIPGRSNALRIAARLGLPQELLRRARERLGRHHAQVEGLLDELEQERRAAEKLGERLRGEHGAAERLRQDYEERMRGLEAERERILGEAGREAEGLLREARQKVQGLLRAFRDRLSALGRARRESLEEGRRLAREMAGALARSDDLEVLAELSPVASGELAAALRDLSRRVRPSATLSEEVEPATPGGAPSPASGAVEDLEPAGGAVEDLEPTRAAPAAEAPEEVPEALPAEAEPQGEGPAAEESREDRLPTTTETEAIDRRPHDDLDQEARIAARTVDAELEELYRRAEGLRPGASRKAGDLAPLKPGTSVYIRRFGQEGRVVGVEDGRVEVQVGVIRITVDRDEVEPVGPPPSETGRLPESRRATISPSLDLRGMTVDEALFELDHRLDEASLAGMEKLEVIHGKGTGALRSAVTQFLKKHPAVLEYRLGETHEGGWGVTVVRLT